MPYIDFGHRRNNIILFKSLYAAFATGTFIRPAWQSILSPELDAHEKSHHYFRYWTNRADRRARWRQRAADQSDDRPGQTIRSAARDRDRGGGAVGQVAFGADGGGLFRGGPGRDGHRRTDRQGGQDRLRTGQYGEGRGPVGSAGHVIGGRPAPFGSGVHGAGPA